MSCKGFREVSLPFLVLPLWATMSLWTVKISFVIKRLYRALCYSFPGSIGQEGKVLTDKGGPSHFPCLSPKPWLSLRFLLPLCVLERRARIDGWIQIKCLLFLFLALGLVLPSSDEFMLPRYSLQCCPVGCKGWNFLGMILKDRCLSCKWKSYSEQY